ncbi:MAG: YHS domain-containing protein [Armatimonadetes bacterium]|nr:YHS domain-containing protein [Armatimonadota bacterium]MBS1727447.1 YHS domain-containing protein [Armatimonadota bacterium]
MKKILLALAAASLLVPAFAQKPVKKDPTEITCAVMKGDKVNIAKALKTKMYADYKGRRYFFCCASCKPQFLKDPAKFKDSPSVPAPKEPTKKKKG